MYKVKITIIFSICLFTCCTQIPQGYVKYQSFDIFALKGYGTGQLKEPYVAVKNGKDTISVLIYEKLKKKILIEYINYGDYWYNFRKEQLKYDPKCECDTAPHYIESFIYNDTIMEYSYYLKDGIEKSNELLKFSTIKNEIWLLSSTGFHVSTSDKFHQLKLLLVDYKTNFKNYEPSLYQKQYYHSYSKLLKNDTLYVRENVGNKTNKFGNLVDVRKLNSLGMFDPDKGASLLNEVLQKKGLYK
ncbi:MAG: hypothetical protein P4L34_08345 [Paludibacter sp.]|nr:hypothetical protein [Paludibacter sp.]